MKNLSPSASRALTSRTCLAPSEIPQPLKPTTGLASYSAQPYLNPNPHVEELDSRSKGPM
jgi:hypothetical protein